MLLKIFISYWKEFVIALILSALVYIVMDWRGQNVLIATQKEQMQGLTTQLETANNKITLYEEEQQKAVANQKLSEQRRLKIIADLTKQVNNLRNQTPPTDCKDAVDWAITQKGDLSWPK